jgi:hypothetical protein
MATTVIAAATRAGTAQAPCSGCDGAQDHRLRGTEPEVQGLAGPGDGEHAEPDSVEHRDRSGEPVQAMTKKKGDERASGGHRQIPPILEGGRRQVVQQDVADDAPTQSSDHAEDDDTDDVQAREALIAWQLQRVSGRLLWRETKTAASDAALPLPDICVRALEGRLELERRLRSQAEAWHESGLVIMTKLGKPVDPRSFYRAFQTRCRRAAAPTTTVHATRKACASLLVALGVHPRVAMQIRRQSQIAVTMDVYRQVTSNSTLRALKAVGQRAGSH